MGGTGRAKQNRRPNALAGAQAGKLAAAAFLGLLTGCGDTPGPSDEVAITALAADSQASVLGATTIVSQERSDEAGNEAADAAPVSTTGHPATTEQPALPTYRRPAAVPEGSGCRPNSLDTLPDGRWFGFLRYSDGSQVDFDLACLYTDEQAVAAATSDEADLASVEADARYIRNDDTAERSVVIEPGVAIGEWADDGTPSIDTGVFYPSWLASTSASGRTDLAVWLEISGNRLRSITPTQFQPEQ